MVYSAIIGIVGDVGSVVGSTPNNKTRSGFT